MPRTIKSEQAKRKKLITTAPVLSDKGATGLTKQTSVNTAPVNAQNPSGFNYNASTRNLPSAPVPTTSDRLKEIDRLLKSRDLGTLSGEEGSKMYRLIAEQQAEDKKAGPSIVRNQGELDEMFKGGKITQSQYDAAKIRLDSGQAGGGLDPTGFNPSEVLGQVGQIGREQPFKRNETPQERATHRAEAIISNKNEGRNFTAEEEAAIRANISQEEFTRQQSEDLTQQTAQRQADRAATQGAASAAEAQKTTAIGNIASGIDQGALAQVLASLPPGSEAIGAAIQGLLTAQDSALSMEGGLFNASTMLAEDVYNKKNDIFDAATRRAEGVFKSASTMLDASRERSSKLLAAEQANAANESLFLEEKQTREARRTLASQIDKMTASLALRGGFGSEDGMADIRDAEMEGEQAILDMQREFGFKRSDMTLKFTALQNEVEDKYTTNWLSALNNYSGRLDTIDLQFAANETSRGAALQSATKDFVTAMGTARTEKAKTILDFTKEVRTTLDQERERVRSDRESALNELKWYKETFGSNVPEGVAESLQQRLGELNVQSVLAAPTSKEIETALKKAKGGGGGFSYGSIGTTGNVPTFDQFIASKEAEMMSSLNVPARDSLRKEYDALVAQEQSTSPSYMRKIMEDKIASLPKHTKLDARNVVEGYLADGDYAGAQWYIDGLGDPPGVKERDSFTQARLVRSWVAELDMIMDDIGMTDPIIGRFREMNPYDSRVVRMNWLITQTIPALARGIFKEVGVLTDQDIATYKSTMPNVQLTNEQADQALKDVMRKIQMSLDYTVDTWNGAKLNTREFRAMAKEDPYASITLPTVGSGMTPSSGSSGSVSDYVRSLGR